MDASHFDTLAAADELRSASFDDRQTHAIIEVHRLAHEPLATKADLKAIRAALEALQERLCRYLWIQGTGIVLIIGSFIAIAAALRLL